MKALKSTEICAIIAECGKNKVSSFKLGDLAIDFKTSVLEDQGYQYTDYSTIESNLANIAASEKAAKETKKETIQADDLFNLALENPQAYEEHISSQS